MFFHGSDTQFISHHKSQFDTSSTFSSMFNEVVAFEIALLC